MRAATDLTWESSGSIVSDEAGKAMPSVPAEVVSRWNSKRQASRKRETSRYALRAEREASVQETPILHRGAGSLDRAAMPDTELISAAQSGDTHAFDELVRRYKSRVFMLAYQKTKSYEDALDITQETFVRAYLALPKWEPKASWYTWLFRITYNLCIDFHRSRNRRRTESLDEPESTLPEPASDEAAGPANIAEENELSRIIRSAVDELSGRQREVFLLHHYGGMQVKEVADTLDIAEGTAKIHLFRAVAKLREVLRPLRERHDI